MAWERVIGQDRAVAALRPAVGGGRVAQAYLVHGPAGAGKRAAALALAQALRCERRGGGGAPADDACGECHSCTRVARMVHPDLHFLFPRTSEADPHDVAPRLALLADDPYTAVDYRRLPSLDAKRGRNLKPSYPVALVRELRGALALRSVENGAVVAV